MKQTNPATLERWDYTALRKLHYSNFNRFDCSIRVTDRRTDTRTSDSI